MPRCCPASEHLNTVQAPTIALASGQQMPSLGLGTLRSGKDVVNGAVTSAISQGYRLIDCAECYGNEAEVGTALKAVIDQGIVTRDDLFIVGKVFNHHHHVDGEDRVRQACETSIQALGVGPIDLYLMHWPFAFQDNSLPKEGLRLPNGVPRPEIKISVEFIRTWAELVKLKEEGLVKAIGVSNFTREQLEELAAASPEKPIVNQVELHPYLYQKELLEYCQKAGIQIMSYSPLGAGAPAHGYSLLENPAVVHLAEKHGVSAGQVLIRWNTQLGNVCIPKSTNPSRIAENLNVFHFELSAEDMEQLAGLPQHRFTRGFVEGQWFDDGEITECHSKL